MDKETKKEFKNLTHIVQKSFGDVAVEITSIKKELKEANKKFVNIDKRFEEVERKSQERHNELMNSNDKMIRIFEASQQEMASQRFISLRQEKRLEHHEKRIKVLELLNSKRT